MGIWWLTSVVTAAALLVACDRPAPVASSATWTASERAALSSLSPAPSLSPSPGNKYADNPKAAALGHALFFDTKLSRTGEVACATCHVPAMFFTDGLPIAQGVGRAARHSPTVLNAHPYPFLFWDGRADSLWAQALGPLEDPNEHGMTRVSVVRVVALHHRKAYEDVFGTLPDMTDTARFPAEARPVPGTPRHAHNMAWGTVTTGDQKAINRAFSNIGKAIEAYERKLVQPAAPFDTYVAALGRGETGQGIIPEAARRGARAFVGPAQCINCHSGPLLSDLAFHNLGLPPGPAGPDTDLGRSPGAAKVKSAEFTCGTVFSDATVCRELEFLDPRFEDFQGAFKTPSLRNVAMTAPYMHTGQFATLPAVLAFYKTLPGKATVGHRETVLELLDKEVDAGDLIAFLESLTSPLPDARWLKPPP